MKLAKLHIENFKSFSKATVEMNDFNVLIGPNAAGKTNFLHILNFLRDISRHGLVNALSLQGGTEFVRNILLKNKNNILKISAEFIPDKPYGIKKEIGGIEHELRLTRLDYSFALDLSEDERQAEIINDSMSVHFDDREQGNDKSREFSFDIKIAGKTVKTSFTKKMKITAAELFPQMEDLEKFMKLNDFGKLIIESPLVYSFPFERIITFIKGIRIYDFDSRIPRQAMQHIGKAELEENGENVAIVLRRILSQEDGRRKFFNFTGEILPFIRDIEVKRYFDKYLQLMIKESYHEEQEIPSSMISEGTLFLLLMVIAMYFEDTPLAIFEEPERRIHPHLISKLIEMMQDASSQKQILISTHNPEIVKFAPPESLLFVSRSEKGMTLISKLKDREEIKTFLQNEIGIEELFIQNLLK